ncbi:MFS general substrate transporter [Violaceomyces palustris]|uniref:MFS general substrate transporter n=1 Tax=Violaceomyces palustris TaxID=1673888 RepID=A0ACD0P0K5_9BASI|nr:MFS general substrate transporter [Violaceomyces palustris]
MSSPLGLESLRAQGDEIVAFQAAPQMDLTNKSSQLTLSQWENSNDEKVMKSLPPSSSQVPERSNSESDQIMVKKTARFWLIFTTLMVVCCLTMIDSTMISTALPSIVRALPVSSVSGTWITSAYLLSMTACQPAFGGLSDVLGRRISLILATAFFMVGSIVCALAPTMTVLVVGRGIKGAGGGGIVAVAEIIVSDLTTLRERGVYVGIIGLVFAVSSFVAPVFGGAFSTSNWRWIFWINLPIGGLGILLIVPFMNLNTPKMDLRSKIERMDLIGNLILLGSVVGILISVTEGGIEYDWSDYRAVVPLACGLGGMLLFFAFEFWPNNPLNPRPILPLRLFKDRTAAGGFLVTFLHGIVAYGALYSLPLYHQAVRGDSPLKSAIDSFPATAPGAPFAILSGALMAITGKYKNMIHFWWIVMIVGFGLMSMVGVDTSKAQWAGFQFFVGTGVGSMFAITLPCIQAALGKEELASSTATFAFCRSFGSIWGIAITTTVLTNTVSTKLVELPEVAPYGLTGRTALGFIESIQLLPENLRSPVREYFAEGLKRGYYVFIPLSALGLLASLLIKDLPLPTFNDTEFYIKDDVRRSDGRDEETRICDVETTQGSSSSIMQKDSKPVSASPVQVLHISSPIHLQETPKTVSDHWTPREETICPTPEMQDSQGSTSSLHVSEKPDEKPRNSFWI